jgi:hypothetical protein
MKAITPDSKKIKNANMKIKITNRFNGTLLYETDADSLGAAISVALRTNVDLCDANLCGANLCGVDLCGADLRGVDLCGANLCGANLRGANLRGVDLCGANLRGADLRGVDLCDANLCGANLRRANLRRANLRDADLCGADLCGAKNAELPIAMTRILPEGEIIGWKKCAGGKIVKLKIPANAKRSHAFGRKCRAEFAVVLEVEGGGTAKSSHDSTFEYNKGATVRPTERFSEDWMQECTSGIHFFITKLEAENYSM